MGEKLRNATTQTKNIFQSFKMSRNLLFLYKFFLKSCILIMFVYNKRINNEIQKINFDLI